MSYSSALLVLSYSPNRARESRESGVHVVYTVLSRTSFLRREIRFCLRPVRKCP